MKSLDEEQLTNLVLENLIDAESGEKLDKEFFKSLTEKGSKIEKLYISGQPGIGKSTILGQIASLFESQKPAIILFDRVQALAEELIRKREPEKKNSKYWNKLNWKFFEKLLQTAIATVKKSEFTFIESPYILYWEKENHGRKIFKRTTRKFQETMFIYVVGDPRTVSRSKEMRKVIAQSTPHLHAQANAGLVSLVKNRFHTVFAGYEDTELSQIKIKEIVARMAPEEAIKKVHKKTKQLADHWSKNPRRNALASKYIKKIVVPPKFNLNKTELNLIQKEAAFLLYILREELKLDTKHSKVIFNPFLAESEVYFQLRFME